MKHRFNASCQNIHVQSCKLFLQLKDGINCILQHTQKSTCTSAKESPLDGLTKKRQAKKTKLTDSVNDFKQVNHYADFFNIILVCMHAHFITD